MSVIGAERGAGRPPDVLFGELTERDWQRVLPLMQRLRFQPGTLLVVQGDDDAALLGAASGVLGGGRDRVGDNRHPPAQEPGIAVAIDRQLHGDPPTEP